MRLVVLMMLVSLSQTVYSRGGMQRGMPRGMKMAIKSCFDNDLDKSACLSSQARKKTMRGQRPQRGDRQQPPTAEQIVAKITDRMVDTFSEKCGLPVSSLSSSETACIETAVSDAMAARQERGELRPRFRSPEVDESSTGGF